MQNTKHGRQPGCALCPTRRLCLARALEQDQLESLGRTVRTSTPMGKDTRLYRAGDTATAWFVVRSGVFKTSTVTDEGDEHVTGFHYPGELIGVEGAADGRHHETATALVSATACALPLADLPRLWGFGAGTALLRLIAWRERHAQALGIILGRTRADARIAGYLKLLMERTERLGFDPTCLAMPMSRTDLARHLGLTLECVSRVLSRWRREGLIATDPGQLKVLRPEDLLRGPRMAA